MLNLNLKDVDYPDCITTDKSGRIVLFAKVRGFPFKYEHNHIGEDLLRIMRNWRPVTERPIEFSMFVDLETILIFQWNGTEFILRAKFNTADVLSHYDPQFRNQRILSLYLTGLTEAWLRDLAYNWNLLVEPPKIKEIAEIGLLQKLDSGDTSSWVTQGDANSLY
ncbi:MAG TPA: hypothetical protein VK203_17865 [Nostocaceae cyanobacterium]|nr:hypothetical protein [Nostocaceae cyanobacterium]